ncbi:hypothetical protein ACWDOR_39080 [Streptosporangium canum]|uniref:hypothetical protein n=1 Tax=Streptosporangium canum TaxID=324952 RepID=UPI0036878605
MALAQAQAPWDPDPGRLDTPDHGLPPRPAFEDLPPRPDRLAPGPHRPETTVDDIDHTAETLTR